MRTTHFLAAAGILHSALVVTTWAAPLSVVDWKAPGDGLLVYDPNTKLEWLKLTVTSGQTYNTVVGKMGTGGDYAGFRYASSPEVATLITNAGIALSPPPSHAPTDHAAALGLLGQWGTLATINAPSVGQTNESWAIIFDTPSGVSGHHYRAVIYTDAASPPNTIAHSITGGYIPDSSIPPASDHHIIGPFYTGSALVRDASQVPNTTTPNLSCNRCECMTRRQLRRACRCTRG